MALEKTVKTAQGFDAKDAYHRVEFVRLLKKDEMAFNVRAYKNATEVTAFSDASYACSYNIDGSNPIKQAYEHLKSLPEFADAADV